MCSVWAFALSNFLFSSTSEIFFVGKIGRIKRVCHWRKVCWFVLKPGFYKAMNSPHSVCSFSVLNHSTKTLSPLGDFSHSYRQYRQCWFPSFQDSFALNGPACASIHDILHFFPIHLQLTITLWLQISTHLFWDWTLFENYLLIVQYDASDGRKRILKRFKLTGGMNATPVQMKVSDDFSEAYYIIWSTWPDPYQAIQTMCQKRLISSAYYNTAEGDW